MYKHNSITGLSSTNLIFDRDLVTLSEELLDSQGRIISTGLADHDNADEIMAVLGMSIDREDNGFRNIDKMGKPDHDGDESYSMSGIESSDMAVATSDPLTQLIADDTGTSKIMEHCSYYLGESRAWRNGWNSKSYGRHAVASRKTQADNGVIAGKYCDVAAHAKREAGRAAKVVLLNDKVAKQEARRLKRLARFDK